MRSASPRGVAKQSSRSVLRLALRCNPPSAARERPFPSSPPRLCVALCPEWQLRTFPTQTKHASGACVVYFEAAASPRCCWRPVRNMVQLPALCPGKVFSSPLPRLFSRLVCWVLLCFPSLLAKSQLFQPSNRGLPSNFVF